MNDRVPERDLSRLAVPRWGRLVETGDRYEPYRLVDADGAVVAPVAVFFQELLAAGKAAATVRSYGMDLLRWWRFPHAVEVPWDRATRVDARDFSCWIQLTVKPRATAAKRRPARTVGAPNPVTGKPSPGLGYAPSTVAHSETVLRKSPKALASDTLDALSFTPLQATALAEGWRDLPTGQIRELRRHKNLTAHLEGLVGYLAPGPVRERLVTWTATRPLLP
ncbi:site-specific integrase [Streptomyces sp. 769]|uniref:site-specific integrase n=1 Tax=Streptomyces sp. 769 TaxID=1262452 RepID=UPI000581BF1B|nr:site-specific integrase [Streptomyces sp. 769]AJC62018.1 putative DNA integrase/recombinase [Streptomyces sp. 769]